MPRRTTELVVGEYYHIYNRGVNREPIFFERDNYLFFLRRLRKHLSPDHVSLLVYCLMPNHYHLLVRLESNEFSARMQALGTSYTKAINKRLGRVGPLFQSRFQAKHVECEEYLVHLSRYIHVNPLVAKLVHRLVDWEFSSYPEYVGRRKGSLPQTEIVLSQFPSRQAYQQFAESGAPHPPEAITHLLFEED
ncbi:MAG TPA: transposase [Planctomycetaceae bacterium]|nr:transposase [Planctomycetaceae bacterium]